MRYGHTRHAIYDICLREPWKGHLVSLAYFSASHTYPILALGHCLNTCIDIEDKAAWTRKSTHQAWFTVSRSSPNSFLISSNLPGHRFGNAFVYVINFRFWQLLGVFLGDIDWPYSLFECFAMLLFDISGGFSSPQSGNPKNSACEIMAITMS